MKLLLLSDIHHGDDIRFGKYISEDYVNEFGSKFLENISEVPLEDADIVVNLGDLICDENEQKDKERIREVVSALGEAKHVIGNHDCENVSKEDFSHICSQPYQYFSWEEHGYKHIILDAEWKIPATITNECFNWLEKELETELPIIVYTHYPLVAQELKPDYYFSENPENAYLKEREKVLKLLEKHNVKLVVNGHTHFYQNTKVNGITHITVPSFSENDGKDKPQALWVEVTLPELKIEVKSIYVS